MDKPKATPKDVFQWLTALAALYITVFSFINLLFEYINYAYPDALNSFVDPYSSSMRAEIASLIVLFPVFLGVMRMIRLDIVRMPEKRNLWVRKWALYLTVFLAAVIVIGDLITLINFFLGGEITTRFVLKVLVVLLVAGGAFLHFLADIWGYWTLYPQRAMSVGYAVAALSFITVASGFFIMGSPNQIRMFRLDDRKVNDLSGIQYQVVYYWQQKESLPQTLADLNDPISGYTAPLDPQSNQPYRYQPKGPLSFELCAAFNAEGPRTSVPNGRPLAPMPVLDGFGKGVQDNWQHGAGETCFTRTIDPERYPPLRKTVVGTD